jgi:hypothetical protein
VKTWVRAKKNIKEGKDIIVPKGEVGFIKRNAVIKEEEGAVMFPQTVKMLTKKSYEEIDMSFNDETFYKALTLIQKFEGHHCKRAGLFQFNIKMYNYEIPEAIHKGFSDRQIHERLSEELSYQLKMFVDRKYSDVALQNDFKWLYDWWTSGRLGGWLILDHADKLDSSFLKYRYQDLKSQEEAGEEVAEEIERIVGEAVDLSLDLALISKKVKRAVQLTTEYVSTDDAWADFFEILEPEQNEVTITCPCCSHKFKVEVE